MNELQSSISLWKKIEVAVLYCPSLISLMVSVDIKQHLKTNEGRTVQTEQQYRAFYDLVFFPVLTRTLHKSWNRWKWLQPNSFMCVCKGRSCLKKEKEKKEILFHSCKVCKNQFPRATRYKPRLNKTDCLRALNLGTKSITITIWQSSVMRQTNKGHCHHQCSS